MKLVSLFLLMCMMAMVVLGQDSFVPAASAKTASVFLTTPLASAPIGTTIAIPVWLTTKNGDVNAFSVSINFDSSALVYAGYFIVHSGPAIIANEQQATSGKVGYLFGMPSAGVFPVGTTLCYLVYFKVVKAVLPQVGVASQPIAQEVDDTTPKRLDADFAVIQSPVAEFFAGPYWSFGPDVTISIVWSSYPAAIWRIDSDGSRIKVDRCIILPNNGRKCTDTPRGGGKVYYYLVWDVGLGNIASPSIEVAR